MPERANRGGKAGLMLINEYLTFKFSFHLLAKENYSVNTAGDGPRCFSVLVSSPIPPSLLPAKLILL